MSDPGDSRFWYCGALVAACVVATSTSVPSAQGQPPAASAPSCRVDGRVTAGRIPLPGVAIVARAGDAVKASTSTDTDGRFTMRVAPDVSYRVTAELTAFTPAERTLAPGAAAPWISIAGLAL